MWTLHVRRFAAAALVGTVLLAGCDDSPTEPPGQIAAELEVSPATISFASIGASETVALVAYDDEGEEIENPSVTWTSSDEDVAVVNDEGLVTATGNGPATITVTSGEAEATVEVTVEQVPATVEITPDELSFTEIGATEELVAVVLDAEGTEIEGAEVAWSSSDESVAVVDESGTVEAVGEGPATITATSGEAEATVEVVVEI